MYYSDDDILEISTDENRDESIMIEIPKKFLQDVFEYMDKRDSLYNWLDLDEREEYAKISFGGFDTHKEDFRDWYEKLLSSEVGDKAWMYANKKNKLHKSVFKDLSHFYDEAELDYNRETTGKIVQLMEEMQLFNND